jgi:hypothetical protein
MNLGIFTSDLYINGSVFFCTILIPKPNTKQIKAKSQIKAKNGSIAILILRQISERIRKINNGGLRSTIPNRN